VDYKQLGDAGELSAGAMPRLTWRLGQHYRAPT
jgi:hypothetical protein